MTPILWAVGGALALYFAQRQGLIQPKTKTLKPAVEIHGELMANCHDPKKLKRAAALFGTDGLPQYSQSLLTKARLMHEMMHGAKDIVERCRAGDQHAMAIAKGIGDQARTGNTRAKISAFLIEQYSKANPNKELAA
jgi:hypothetical protein